MSHLPNDRFLFKFTHDLLIRGALMNGHGVKGRLHVRLLIVIFIVILLLSVLVIAVLSIRSLVLVLIAPTSSTSSFAFHNLNIKFY